MSTSPSATLPTRLTKDDVRSLYERIAPLYDIWAALTESRARHRCIELADIRDGEDILEVAVGTGLTFADILRKNPSGRTEGVDLTAGMLRRAETRAQRLGRGRFHLAVGDAYDLRFPDRSFDLLINNYMFDLLPEKDFGRVLAEFLRVLRPGGRMVLVNMAQGERLRHRVYNALYQIRPQIMGGCRGVVLLPHVEAAGFVGVQRDYVAQLGFSSEILRATRPAE
jgi:ubiquinone/menaquinone biosynthesis C-methylase UbiE